MCRWCLHRREKLIGTGCQVHNLSLAARLLALMSKPHYDTWHTVGSMASIASERAWNKAIGGRGQVGEMLVVFKTCEDLALVMQRK